MIDATHKLPLTRQAELLDLSRSNVYYLPRPVSDADLAMMRRIDELHLNFPFAGARMLRDMLKLEGNEVGRKHVRTLMERMVDGVKQRGRLSDNHLGRLDGDDCRQLLVHVVAPVIAAVRCRRQCHGDDFRQDRRDAPLWGSENDLHAL
jgi:hypothetical protein